MNEAKKPQLFDMVAVLGIPPDSDVEIGDVGTVVELLPPRRTHTRHRHAARQRRAGPEPISHTRRLISSAGRVHLDAPLHWRTATGIPFTTDGNPGQIFRPSAGGDVASTPHVFRRFSTQPDSLPPCARGAEAGDVCPAAVGRPLLRHEVGRVRLDAPFL